MSDRLRVALLILLLIVLVAAYFITVQFLIGPCSEIGRYSNGAPIYDCTDSSSLTIEHILTILSLR